MYLWLDSAVQELAVAGEERGACLCHIAHYLLPSLLFPL